MTQERDAEKLTLVVVSAHPDDIVCCGGIAAKYARRGHSVIQLSVTLGETVRRPGPEQEAVKVLRRAEGDAIAKILGAKSEYLDVPCNKIIPTMEMKMKFANALRRLKANVVLYPTPWDCHADHRNLSWTMRDVVYYVGHAGIAADHPPCVLKAACMFDVEVDLNELHEPDLLVDVSDVEETNFAAILCEERARVFGVESGRQFQETLEAWTRFWGMRAGVRYAEPLWQSFGSMDMTEPWRKRKVSDELPVR
jgi:LmbE family N-acetylglucosaminyl deacetylase